MALSTPESDVELARRQREGVFTPPPHWKPRQEEVDLKKDGDAWGTLGKIAIGPTGNLRAPAIRTGSTWLVGFNEEAYAERFD